MKTSHNFGFSISKFWFLWFQDIIFSFLVEKTSQFWIFNVQILTLVFPGQNFQFFSWENLTILDFQCSKFDFGGSRTKFSVFCKIFAKNFSSNLGSSHFKILVNICYWIRIIQLANWLTSVFICRFNSQTNSKFNIFGIFIIMLWFYWSISNRMSQF